MMKILRILTVLGASLVLAACTSVEPFTTKNLSAQFDKFDVRLSITGNDQLVSDNPRNNNCTNFPNNDNNRKGCFVGELNRALLVSVSKPGTPNRPLQAFQICPASSKPADWSTCSMTAEQQADWLIISAQNVAWVDSNGMVDLDTSGYDGVDEFDIVNFNTVTADYFYRIQSCRTDGSDCIWMDPGIMNRGRGRF